MNESIVGLDCGRGSVYACPISGPIENLKEFSRSYKPKILKATRADLEELASLGDIFGIEPTGADHRVFVRYLEEKGKTIKYCKGERVRNHAKSRGLQNKKDREDASAIADYTWIGVFGQGSNDSNHFINMAGEQIRDLYNQHKSIDRVISPAINQIWARLAEEFPEFQYTETGTARRFATREWLDKTAAKPLQWIAGDLPYPRMEAQLEKTEGTGLSPKTRSLAKLICLQEEVAYDLEIQLERALQNLEPFYKAAFNRWNISPLIQCGLLGSIYPFQKFLREDGTQITEYVPAVSPKAKHEKTYRNRSLKRFMLMMGMGRVIAESGKSKGELVMGGSAITRSVIYLFIKSSVIMHINKNKPRKRKTETPEEYKKRLSTWQEAPEWIEAIADDLRQPRVKPWENPDVIQALCDRNKITPDIAWLQVYYLLAPECKNLKDDQVVMKLGARFTTRLYRALYQEFKKSRGDMSLQDVTIEEAMKIDVASSI